MPSTQKTIQIVDTHEPSETLAVTRLQRVGYQINRTLLGGEIDEAMPSIDGNKPSIVPGRRDANGNRKIRGHCRDIKRSQFKKMSTASELLDALFG
jgi:hypothetical protein